MKIIKVLFFALLVLLILIIAYSQTKEKKEETNLTNQQEKEAVDSVIVTERTILDKCKEVKCKENEVCSEGSCICAPDFKQCKGNCIPTAQCCTSLDCESREECANSKCIKSKFCDFSQHWEESKKECVCDEKTKWCKEQNKCIKYDSCCDEIDCKAQGMIDRLCKKTTFIPTVCIKNNNGQHCTSVAEGSRESFGILGDYGDIYFKKVYEKGIGDIKIIHKSEIAEIDKLNLNEERSILDGFSAKITGVDVKGGNCKGS